ncbi:hypothetical protein [Candidatus Nitrosocosmicus sp. R]
MTSHALETHGHHFHCISSGSECVAPHMKEEGFFFMHPRMKKEMQEDAHDDTLIELTDKINKLVNETASKRKDKNLRIAVTSKGLLWIWTNQDNDYTNADTEMKKLDDYALLEIFGLKQSTSKA